MAILKRSKKADSADKPKGKDVVAQNEPKVESSKLLGADLSGVILKPLVSEKAATLTSANQYVFVVRKSANRIEIRNAIRQLYGVDPSAVNVMNVLGKEVRFGRRSGKRSDWKKAIVTLPAGKTINVYEGV